MKTNTFIIWALLLSLLMLGGCYSIRTMQLEQVDQKKLHATRAYVITEVYMEDGALVQFSKSSRAMHQYYGVSKDYAGPMLEGDTLHGELRSGELVALPVDKIASYRIRKFDVLATVLMPPLAFVVYWIVMNQIFASW